ncbi:MAG: response regulator transcription factor [Gemmatimonadetes bacterium]|nr:response regulator transcription factor [Gemmatimonadota bacterium]
MGEAKNGLEVLDLVDRTHPDALFLDIRMPGLDGLGVVAELDPAHAPAVVFVTSFDEYAVQAFEAQAVDYLLKPFDPARLAKAVDRVRGGSAGIRARPCTEHRRARRTAVGRPGGVPRTDRGAWGRPPTTVLEVADIRWIEAADNYVRLHTAEGVHLSCRTMRDLEALLDPKRFARIHRSAIVALRLVRELRPLGDGDQELLLEGGGRLVLTRSYRDAFEARFGGVA